MLTSGGVGKSSLAIAIAVFMAAGRTPIGWPYLVNHRLRVWVFNLEDPKEEIQRRVQATCKRWNMEADDLQGHLSTSSGRGGGLSITRRVQDGVEVDEAVCAKLVEELLEHQIDVVIIDPFVSSHQASENDNSAMDMVAKAWVRIADEAGVAVLLIHHTRKSQGGKKVGAEDGRGAKAIIEAAREVLVLSPFSDNEAQDFAVQNKGAFWVRSEKRNMAAKLGSGDAFHMESVLLENGDDVGVACSFHPEYQGLVLTDEQRSQVAKLASTEQFRADVQADEWFGYELAKMLSIDVGPAARSKTSTDKQKSNRRKMAKLIKNLRDEEIIFTVRKSIGRGKDGLFITAGCEANEHNLEDKALEDD